MKLFRLHAAMSANVDGLGRPDMRIATYMYQHDNVHHAVIHADRPGRPNTHIVTYQHDNVSVVKHVDRSGRPDVGLATYNGFV